MCSKTRSDLKFYGTARVGEKGQIVIPVEARHDMSIEKGEKIIVFGAGENMLALIKFSEFEQMNRLLQIDWIGPKK